MRPRHTDLPARLRALAFHWRDKGFPRDADVYDLAAEEIERLWGECGYDIADILALPRSSR